MDIKKLLIIFIAVLLIFSIFLMGCEKKQEEIKPDIKIIFDEETKADEQPEKKEEIVYVKIHKFRFEPDIVNITMGTTVVWENVDDYPHFIRTTQAGFQSPILKPGEKFNLTFDIAHRKYTYVEPSFGMLGYINVE